VHKRLRRSGQVELAHETPSLMVRLVRGEWKKRPVPAWGGLAFASLGLIYLVAYPLGARSWSDYIAPIVLLAILDLLFRRRFRTTLVEFSETDTEWIYVIRQVVKIPRWARRRSWPVPPNGELDSHRKSSLSQPMILDPKTEPQAVPESANVPTSQPGF